MRDKGRGMHPAVVQLFELRRHRRRSVEWLARRCGWNGHSIGKWQSGNRCPTIWALHDMAAALGHEIILRPKPE